MPDTLPPTILIVDDEADFREFTSRLLTAQGYQVRLAADCGSALAVLGETPHVCAVLLDLVLPGMSSRAFCAAMRREPRFAGIPVIVISGHPRGEERARQLRSAAYFRKPFELPDLAAAIRRSCALHGGDA